MFSDTVKARVQALHAKLPQVSVAMNLVFCYQFMLASHDLTVKAAERSKGELGEYFRTHATEEEGHADWLKDDLRQAGYLVGAFPLSPNAEAMIGAQYYHVLYGNPAHLLGHMAYLEMCPVPMSRVEALEKQHGKHLFRTLRYHAQHDIEHSKDLCRILDTLDEDSQKSVMDGLEKTAYYFSEEMKFLEAA